MNCHFVLPLHCYDIINYFCEEKLIATYLIKYLQFLIKNVSIINWQHSYSTVSVFSFLIKLWNDRLKVCAAFQSSALLTQLLIHIFISLFIYSGLWMFQFIPSVSCSDILGAPVLPISSLTAVRLCLHLSSTPCYWNCVTLLKLFEPLPAPPALQRLQGWLF